MPNLLSRPWARSFGPEDLARIEAHTFIQRVEHYAELESTNDRATQIARDRSEDELPALVLVDLQTNGRGRGENRWWSAPGGLTFSLVMDAAAHGLAAEEWPKLSLATALTVADSLDAISPGINVGLKWPNDVWVDGRKIAGILVEAQSGDAPRLVVGLGLNVNNVVATAPPAVQALAVSLCDATNHVYSLVDVLALVLRRLAGELERMAAGTLNLRERWDARCVLKGKRVEVHDAQSRVAGPCLGVQEDGGLVIRAAVGPRVLYSGVVAKIE